MASERISSSFFLFVSFFLVSFSLNQGTQAQEPNHQSCFQRICRDPKPFVDCLETLPLAVEGEGSSMALSFAVNDSWVREKKSKLRFGGVEVPVGNPLDWVQWKDSDEHAWADVIVYSNAQEARDALEYSGEWYAGSLRNHAHHYFTLEAGPGQDSVAMTVHRDQLLLNFGVTVPVSIRRPEHSPPNQPEDYQALDESIDRLLHLVESVLHTICDPKRPSWIPKARPGEEDLRAMRVASFCRLWSEVKRSFVFAGQRPGIDGVLTKKRGPDWEALLEPTLMRILQAEDDDAYVRILQETVALLEDGHTRVYPAESYDRSPVRIASIENKPVILDVAEGVLGIEPGMEILEVEGIPVETYLRERIRPYLFSSTPHYLDQIACSHLLDGRRGDRRSLVVSDASGARSEVEVEIDESRQRASWRNKPVVEFRELDEGIVYVALNSFSSDEVVEAFDALFPKILGADALILDVRENGGGNSGHGYAIMGRLIQESCALTSTWRTREYRAAHAAWNQEETWVEGSHGVVKPRGTIKFDGEVIVLIGPHTFSAAEDFLVPMKASGRAILIGEPTGGSTGQPMSVQLYKAFAQICTKWDRFPDGTEFVGVGIQPDVLVRPTIQDIRDGYDRVLQEALDYL